MTIVASILLVFIAGMGVGFLIFRDGERPSPMLQAIEERALVVTVVDGDTAILENGERVRYLGIDTPEVGSQECFSSEATLRNRELVEGKTVTLVPEAEDRDQFGRLLRWIFLDDGTFVNAELIWDGYARSFFFGESRFRQIFVQLQVAADQAGAGGWSVCSWQ